jgi:hypothetical protein
MSGFGAGPPDALVCLRIPVQGTPCSLGCRSSLKLFWPDVGKAGPVIKKLLWQYEQNVIPLSQEGEYRI